MNIPKDSVRLMLIAVEWGFKACEKGWNLEETLLKFRELMKDKS